MTLLRLSLCQHILLLFLIVSPTTNSLEQPNQNQQRSIPSIISFQLRSFNAKKSSSTVFRNRTKALEFDEGLARQLIFLAAGAYANETALKQSCLAKAFPANEQWTEPVTDIKICDVINSTCSFIWTRSSVRKKVVIAFKGTDNLDQLLMEFWNGTQPEVDFFGLGKVNSYSFTAMDSLWPTIQDILLNLADDYKVIFTGHSLGAAMSSLAAIRAIIEGLVEPDQVFLYNFGQPRMGSAEYAFFHNKLVPNSFRLVNGKDLIPHLPSCVIGSTKLLLALKNHKPVQFRDAGWCNPRRFDKAYHHGTEVWYPERMGPGAEFVLCLGRPPGEDAACSNSVDFKIWKKEKLIEYAQDHRYYFGHEVSGFGRAGCPDDYYAERRAGAFRRKMIFPEKFYRIIKQSMIKKRY